MSKVMVVGGIPEPIGGVTNFIYRVANNNLVSKVIDLYPADNKQRPPLFVGEIVYLNIFSFIIKYWFSKSLVKGIELIHFNFSTPKSLLLLTLLPKKNRRFVLMLHHGDLALKIPRFIIKRLLGKFNKIYFLSEKQREFYLKCGVDKGRLLNKTSYLPLKEESVSNVDRDVIEKVELIKSRGCYCVISGYCSDIYNHHWVVNLFNDIEKERELIIFLYGDLNNDYFSLIKKNIDNNPRISLFLNRTSNSFNYALASAEIYLRPNSQDSFGIAVADAISFGVSVLASSVCERYPGTYIFKPDSFVSFLEAYRLLIGNNSALSVSRAESDNFVFHYD